MTDINTVAIVGNLVRDSELKSIGQSKVLNFTIASNESVKNGDNWESRPNFIDCSIFGKQGESLFNFMKKGQKVVVQGYLHQDRWQDNAGVKQQRIIVRANSIELVGHTSSGNSSQTTQNQQGTSQAKNNVGQGNFQEDIPF